MDPVTRAILSSWDLRPEVILVLSTLMLLYGAGWVRLRRKGGRLATYGRLVAYFSGLFLIGIALMSPVETLAGQLFFMHMIQHLLLIMLVPPLLMLANPFPFAIWGLPAGPRRVAGGWLSRLMHRDSSFRRALRQVSGPGTIWLLYVILLVAWHDPNAYNAALRIDWVHDLEHFSFLLPALASWWLITGAAPHIQKPLAGGVRIAYVIAAIPPAMLLGIALAFSTQPAYTYYLTVPRPWGLSVLQDQMLGGVLMWVPGSMMYIIAVLILTARWLDREEKKPPLPMSKWSTDEAMIAPGLEK